MRGYIRIYAILLVLFLSMEEALIWRYSCATGNGTVSQRSQIRLPCAAALGELARV
jgi:hypothetical protein